LVGVSLQPIRIDDRRVNHICRSYGDIPA
jgi:hypothetical protein